MSQIGVKEAPMTNIDLGVEQLHFERRGSIA